MPVDINPRLSKTGTATPPRWVAWLVLALVWLCILVSYRASVALIVEAWETLPSHAHGYVVLLVVAYLAWRKRDDLTTAPLVPSKMGVLAFTVAGAAGFAGELVSAAVVVQFAIVFMLQFAIWAILGNRAFRILLGPLSFLFFAIPFGHDILPTLMDWTANATVIGLRASGVPVLQLDRNFVIPSGSWSVIEACAGIRYLLTSVFVGSLFAYLTYSRWYKRILFIIWMLILPLLANWLRAYSIVMIAHLSDNRWGFGLSHLTLGWIIFGLAIFGSFALGMKWHDPEKLPQKGQSVPLQNVMHILAVAALVVAIVVSWQQAPQQLLKLNSRSVPVLDLPRSLQDMVKTTPSLPMLAPAFSGAAATHEATYRFENGEIGVFLAYYRNQSQGSELINVNNFLEPTQSWEWRSSKRLKSPGGGIPEMRLEAYSKANAQAVAATVYWIGGFATTSEIQGKLYQALNMVLGKGDDGAMVVITASDSQSPEAAKALIEAFVQQRMKPLLDDLNAIQAKAGQ